MGITEGLPARMHAWLKLGMRACMAQAGHATQAQSMCSDVWATCARSGERAWASRKACLSACTRGMATPTTQRTEWTTARLVQMARLRGLKGSSRCVDDPLVWVAGGVGVGANLGVHPVPYMHLGRRGQGAGYVAEGGQSSMPRPHVHASRTRPTHPHLPPNLVPMLMLLAGSELAP